MSPNRMTPSLDEHLAAVEAHISAMPEPHQTTIRVLRERLRVVLPEADEMLKYAMPCFVVNGKGVACYEAFKNHCSYFPMGGGVLSRVSGIPAGWTMSKGGLRFPIDEPPSQALVRRLVKASLAQFAEHEAARAAAKLAKRSKP